MSTTDPDDGITTSKEVQDALNLLASDHSKAAQFWGVIEQINRFVRKLRENPKIIKSRLSAHDLVRNEKLYSLYIIPYPMIIMFRIDTLGILVRDEDLAVYVFAHANCNSIINHRIAARAMQDALEYLEDDLDPYFNKWRE